MIQSPDITKIASGRPCVFIAHKQGDKAIEALLGVREPQQEAKPPDGRARLARGLEALLRQQAKPPQVGTIVPASSPSSRQRKPRQPVPGGLLTAAQAAAKLGCSIKTLNGYVKSGALKYVAIGHGTKRPRRMYTDAELNEFIANQTRKVTPCLSDATRAPRSGNTISRSEVIAFTARPNARTGAKRKR